MDEAIVTVSSIPPVQATHSNLTTPGASRQERGQPRAHSETGCAPSDGTPDGSASCGSAVGIAAAAAVAAKRVVEVATLTANDNQIVAERIAWVAVEPIAVAKTH